ncbi:glycosyltransferase [Viridibacillus arvi]|uniref:glycosyltransferase n=1 Tax=Viridibacillus arvi TaxID=263475 RepID=UPI003697AA86
MMNRKVLHILSTDGLAGAENVAMCIINNLSELSESAYSSPMGSIEKILISRDITYIPMKKLSIKQIRKAIKIWKPDIIHAHDFTATLKSLIASFNIPVVSHIHQYPKWLKSINKFSILFFLACIKIKKIIVVTPAIKEHTFLSRLFKEKTIVIKNIVDVKRIAEMASVPTERRYDVAFVGRLEDVKDPLRFIKIIYQLVKEMPTISIVMMGEGSLEGQCKNLIKELALEKNIDLIGFMNNPYPVLQNSKILVMTSKSEGLPMVAIEALSMGKPIIVPNLEEMKSIVNSNCGVICKDNQEFINAIISLLLSENEYAEMSLRASKKAEEMFNMEDYKNQLQQVYCSVL